MAQQPAHRAAAAAALLAVAAYANTLPNGFVRDDDFAIVRNEAAHHPIALRRILLTSSWSPPDLPTTSYRPLATWTFALNRALHGAAPLGYHAVNVALHAAATVLVVLLAGALGLGAWTAGLAGMLFAVHPVNTEAVASAVGRADVLAGALVLGTLLAQRRMAARPSRLATAGTLAAFALALLAKEHAIALVVLLPLADLLFADDGSLRLFARRLGGPRGLFYLGVGVLAAAYLGLRLAALGDVIGAGGEGIAQIPFWLNPVAAAPVSVRVLTALEMLAVAVSLLVWPVSLSADYSYAHVRPVTSLAAPGALVGIAAVILVAALGVALRKRRAAFFWLALAVSTYAVVSNLLVPIATPLGERFLYLPCAGFSALVAMALAWLAQAWSRTAATVIAALLVVACGARTVVRNTVWRDDLSLALASVESAPESAHAHAYLGTVYTSLGRDGAAVAELERALAIYPQHTEALFNLAAHHLQQGRLDEALADLRRLVEVEPRHFGAWVDTAAVHLRRGDAGAALAAADRAVAIRADAPNGHVLRGFALQGLGRPADARAEFEQVLRRPPVPPDALAGFAATSLELGDVRRATIAYEHLVAEVADASAFRGLVESYRRAGRQADAERTRAAARQRFPSDPSFQP